ncbi:MAG: peptide chain release factor-like protein [Gemmataceae bacterium]
MSIEGVTLARSKWTQLNDTQLLAQCEVDTYRASGPGGQKRNKTSSAVRIRHPASGLIVIAEESRSQHENRAKALQRLRQAFFLEIRLPVADLNADAIGQHPDLMSARSADGHLHLGRKDPRFWPAVGVVLDVLAAVEAKVSEAAALLGTSTGNLVDFLQTHPRVWQQANVLRGRFGQKPLKSD